MIERLLRGVVAPATDVVSVGLLRLGGALRSRWRVRRDARADGTGRADTGADGERTTEELVLEVAVTTAALALAPLIAGALVHAIARSTVGRRR